MTKRKAKLQSTPTPSDKGIATYENGKFKYWQPYEQYLASKFFGKVFSITHTSQWIWGKADITNKEQIYEIAKEVYKEFQDELPISYLEHYKT